MFVESEERVFRMLRFPFSTIAGLGAGSIVALALASIGCGNTVIVGTGGSGSGGSTASTPSTGAKTSATTTGKSVSTSVSSSTGMGPCAALGEAACLGAYPQCAPVYDDTCCPTCNPGTCADCIHLEFHHCGSLTEVCNQGPLVCGLPSKEACAGQPMTCPDQYCPANPGCVEGCLPDANVNCTPACRPVTAGSCTSLCNQPPPLCPMGLTAEQNGTCYTGFCIPAKVCAP